MNKIILTGRLVKDVELLKSKNGTLMVNNVIALNDGKDIEGNDVTYFFNFKCFKGWAENLANNAKKGDKILLSGKLTSSTYVNDMGNKQTYYVIICETAELLTYTKKEEIRQEEIVINDNVQNDDLPF